MSRSSLINNMAVSGGIRDAYVGETRQQLREGYGVYNYDNKFFRYEGEWKGGNKHGHGKLIMADGSFYEGEFKNGEIEGHGFRLYSTTGNRYSGQFHQGELDGQGVMNYADGAVYEGEWARNRRQGYGVLRLSDNTLYQGYLWNHKKHGEGTQIYSNGDRYDGDWVQDKRQGHGELRCRDGTIYDGQWSNDHFNGQGSMQHVSGVVYEGLWINGRPAVLATKLVIKTAGPVELIQGTPFVVEVECQDEDGNAVTENGREIQILAGVKVVLPVSEKKDEDAPSGLFDMIEDLEEKPIPTPFGYSIMTYPITDQFPTEELEDGSKAGISIIDSVVAEEGEEEETADANPEDAPGKTEEPKTEPAANTDDPGDNVTDQDTTIAGTSSEEQTGSDPHGGVTADTDEAVLPPPAANQRSENGRVLFTNLVLTGAPPMYRPFMMMDDDKAKRSKSRSVNKPTEEPSIEAPTPQPATKSSKASKKKGHQVAEEKFARADAGLHDKQEEPAAVESNEAQDECGKLIQCLADAGEYVVLVQDVTQPAFMDITLEPAFIQVKITAPKKTKTKAVKKERGPRWDTSKHIAEAMVRS